MYIHNQLYVLHLGASNVWLGICGVYVNSSTLKVKTQCIICITCRFFLDDLIQGIELDPGNSLQHIWYLVSLTIWSYVVL